MLRWRTDLDRALAENRSAASARYVQLATIREDGTPANRTLVFRGFAGEPAQLLFLTDGRSHKAGQITARPVGEACWFFPETMEQFRFHGLLALVGEDHADESLREKRTILWQQIDDNVRQLLSWPAPGQLRDPASEFQNGGAEDQAPPEHFNLLLLNPTIVDYLDLTSFPHKRIQYWKGEKEEWEMRDVNP